MKKIIQVLLVCTLFISCSKDKEVETTTTTVVDNATILTFKDIELSQTNSSTTLGRYFSTKLGKTLKQSEVNSSNGADIDLVYVGGTSGLFYFESPDRITGSIAIPNAQKSLFKNYLSGFTVADFDAMTDDTKLKNLEVINDNESIGTLSLPLIVTFKNAAGKKGVIKLKAINAERLLVDIKVQK